jgi:hypothetical protein
MTTTIEMMTARRRNEPVSANAKRLAANWQNRLEAGGYVQRKLRLAFTNVAAHQPGICALDISSLGAITKL